MVEYWNIGKNRRLEDWQSLRVDKIVELLNGCLFIRVIIKILNN